MVCPSPFYDATNTPRAALTLAPETPSTSNFSSSCRAVLPFDRCLCRPSPQMYRHWIRWQLLFLQCSQHKHHQYTVMTVIGSRTSAQSNFTKKPHNQRTWIVFHILYKGPTFLTSKLPLSWIHGEHLDSHLIRGSFGPPESIAQTASRSVQQFLQGSRSWPTHRLTDRLCYSVSNNFLTHIT